MAIEEELWFGGHDPAKAEDAAAKSVAALVGRIVGAKPFPESARRLATLTRKDVVRIEPIIQVLERDPALSARLLRLVNSAGYALRQRCTSVRHAATLVGTDRLHQIATTAAVLDLFDSRSSSAARIIEHSTIVGAFCRYFGAHLALPVDDLFTAGFLHDIGKLMLLETEGVQYVALLEKYATEPDVIHVVERSLYGFDHAVLAAHVLNEWNIPDPVPKIVAWHHDPTRAYKSSGMMAALVQTVRLADAAVYAMVRGVTQEEFSTLAAAESASYLDISEPQLSSMWDELQTLYRESIEQCRGENAPALDPRSMRPKQPLTLDPGKDTPRSTELPLQFPCVVCNSPTFGNTCSACGGHMCPQHQVGRESWCTICARDFHSEELEATAAMSPRWALFIGIATVLVSIAIGYQTGGFAGGLRAGIGTTLLIVLALLLTVVGGRLILRFRFIRSRPNRTIGEALENDGGVQSIVPPSMDEPARDGTQDRDPVSDHIRLSGALVEHVKIQDFPAMPQILAPRALEDYQAALKAPHGFDERLDGPKAASDYRAPVDSARERAQSQSLVTLPVPAHDHHDRHQGSDKSGTTSDPPSGFGLPTPFNPDAPPSSVRGAERYETMPAASHAPAASQTAEVHPIIAMSASPIEETRAATLDARASSTRDPGPGGREQADQAARVNHPDADRDRTVVEATLSSHPLAALGLHPEPTSQRLHKVEPLRDAPAVEAPAQPTNLPSVRDTLLGLSVEEVVEAASRSGLGIDAQPTTLVAPSPSVAVAPSPSVAVAPSPSVEAAPSPSVEAAPSPSVEAAPSPSVEVPPSPSVAVAPSPSVAVAPSPSVAVAPSPSVAVAPSPSVEAAPSPSVEVAPSPSVAVAPSPSVEVAPSPSVEVAPSPSVEAAAPRAIEPAAQETLGSNPRTTGPSSSRPAADNQIQVARAETEGGDGLRNAAASASPVASPKDDPAPAIATNAQALMQPLLAAFGEDMQSKVGQELQAKVLEMVAERVAAAVAKQMIENLGQSMAPPSARSRSSRKPSAMVQASAPPPSTEPAKRSRKRAAKP